jgi:two-component system cell cycle response regulator
MSVQDAVAFLAPSRRVAAAFRCAHSGKVIAVTDSKNLSLLVVEDDLADEQLLCEALTEIEEKRQWCNWRSAAIVQVDQLSDALDCLRRQRFDAVLLNLSLPDSPALLDSFLEVNACAQGTPVIILADEEDENLAHRLIREGAEDFLLKSELECGPLARSIRYAIERRRRNSADPELARGLTAVLSRNALNLVAPHLLRLAFASDIDAHLAMLEIGGLPATTSEDREARELFLIRAADVLQDRLPSPALVGRVGKCRFASILTGVSSSEVRALMAGAAREIEDVLQRLVAASVSFSVHQLPDLGSLEALLSQITLAQPRQREPLCHAKPVMLTD